MMLYELRYNKDTNRRGRCWASNKREIKRIKRDLKALGTTFPAENHIIRHDVGVRQNDIIRWLNDNVTETKYFPVAEIRDKRLRAERVVDSYGDEVDIATLDTKENINARDNQDEKESAIESS